MNIKKLEKKIEKKANYFKEKYYKVSQWLLKKHFFTDARISYEDRKRVAEILVTMSPYYIDTIRKSSTDKAFVADILKDKLNDPSFCFDIITQINYMPGDTYYVGGDDQLEEDSQNSVNFREENYELVPKEIASSTDFIKKLFDIDLELKSGKAITGFRTNAAQTPFEYFGKLYPEETVEAVKSYVEENKKDKQVAKYAKVVLTEKMPKLAKEIFGKARANEDLSK